MLVLTVIEGERVCINGRETEVVLISAERGRARLGFNAPKDIPIHREEVLIRIEKGEPERRRQ